MKIHQEDNLILTNSTNEKKFTIQASAKAFQILSSALYSRKIEAIIRELGCNAADSHTQAGCPERQFVVHLPNAWEPEFYVEDFGIGLDADDVENIYTSYFTSTKTNSNDVTGGFGLGSKTPFSYCDSFNIRARKNGMEFHFNAFINMQGEPATTLLSQVATTEPNGVRVSVPVKAADHHQFRTDAQTVYKWFANVPKIIGGVANNGEGVTVDNSKAMRLIKERSFWSEYSKDGWNKNSITVVMGNVAYLVPKVAETFATHFNPSEVKFFEHNSLFIQFEIGDLDVAASRETISFDEDTEKAFIKRVKEVIANFCAETQVKLDGEITTVQDAIALVNSEVGTWANAMFNYDGATVANWAATNFITLLRKELGDEFEDYYFARTRKGTIKRHSLDYIGGFTFNKLDKKRLVILVGNDKGFQTIARQLATSYWNDYGVFFINDMPDDTTKDELFKVFGGYLTFEVAADLIAADKAKRKAERERLKALQGPTTRTTTTPRIGRDSIRANVFMLTEPDADGYVNSSFNQKKVIGPADVKDKAFMILVERYNASEVRFKHPLTGVEHTKQQSTTSETEMYNFCRIFKIDVLIIIKAETQKKAEALFGGKHTTLIETFDVDHIKALTVRYLVAHVVETSIKVDEWMMELADYAPASLVEELVRRGEEYVANNPGCDLAKLVDMTKHLRSYDYYSNIPVVLRTLADDTVIANYMVKRAKETTNAIYEDLRKDYPMAFLDGVEDGKDLNDYIYYMDKLRELDLIVKEVEITVVDDDVPF